MSDELANANLANILWDFDRRTIVPTLANYSTDACDDGNPTVYTVLSTARFDADKSLQLLDSWTDEQVPGRTGLIATAASYAGYSLVLLGEGMCSAALDVGPELTPVQILTEAEARFTRAIDAVPAALTTAPTAADSLSLNSTLNLALLGRARARLGFGQQGRGRSRCRAGSGGISGYGDSIQHQDAAGESDLHLHVSGSHLYGGRSLPGSHLR